MKTPPPRILYCDNPEHFSSNPGPFAKTFYRTAIGRSIPCVVVPCATVQEAETILAANTPIQMLGTTSKEQAVKKGMEVLRRQDLGFGEVPTGDAPVLMGMDKASGPDKSTVYRVHPTKGVDKIKLLPGWVVLGWTHVYDFQVGDTVCGKAAVAIFQKVELRGTYILQDLPVDKYWMLMDVANVDIEVPCVPLLGRIATIGKLTK